ncbi:hypothetical protein GQ602_001075 [Ophiocordyceps camponoti-floridani]|uniref:Uncharacterized protein n=1 Tax=Ophiocordyceps camponoti-floridani TaxID=2030778 RepID=A0A8H4QDG9_9HYPO|nr:hypothetical protein GQ602_001075 [Ophiocordyceps camponoti-floridani]
MTSPPVRDDGATAAKMLLEGDCSASAMSLCTYIYIHGGSSKEGLDGFRHRGRAASRRLTAKASTTPAPPLTEQAKKTKRKRTGRSMNSWTGGHLPQDRQGRTLSARISVP